MNSPASSLHTTKQSIRSSERITPAWLACPRLADPSSSSRGEPQNCAGSSILSLQMLQQRILATSAGKLFILHVTRSAKEFLLSEGTDFRYGPPEAGHRATARAPVVESDSHGLDSSRRSHSSEHSEGSVCLTFFREAETSEAWKVLSGAAA
jgi:hypothetical protein